MRTITTTVTVYTFDELSEAAQKKAVETIAAKLGGEWWDQHDNDAISEVIRFSLAHEIGTPGVEQWGIGDFPGIDGVTLDGWDLERGQSIALNGKLTRANAPKLPWVEGIESIDMDAKRDHTYYTVLDSEPECACTRLGYIAPHDDGCPINVPNPATDAQRRALIEAAKDAARKAWQAGYDEAEYKSGEEHAREWIDGNEREFTADGSLYSE